MAKYKHGDIFANIMEDGRYMFGRLLMDVKKQCVNKKLIDNTSSLASYSGTFLIEIYKEISTQKKLTNADVMIHGIFVTPFALKDGTWEIIDHIPVDPTKVDFQEGLVSDVRKLYFIKGELQLEIPKPPAYQEKIGVGLYMEACGNIDQMLDFYLHNSPVDPKGPLYKSDLRYNNYRKEVYSLIKEDINQSYHEMAQKHGFDLSRFYC